MTGIVNMNREVRFRREKAQNTQGSCLTAKGQMEGSETFRYQGKRKNREGHIHEGSKKTRKSTTNRIGRPFNALDICGLRLTSKSPIGSLNRSII